MSRKYLHYKRHRVTDERNPVDWSYQDSPNENGSIPLPYQATRFNAEGDYKSIDDVYDTSFYERRKRGEVIMNPCSITSIVDTVSRVYSTCGPITNPGFDWGSRVFSGAWACAADGGLSSEKVHQQSALNELIAIATTAAFAKVEQADVLLPVMGWEGRKTVEMFKSPLKSARKHLQAYGRRRRSLESAGMSLNEASSAAWLEYQFGWRNVVKDLQGCFQAAVKARDARGVMTRKVAKSGSSREFSRVWSTKVVIPGTNASEAEYSVITKIRVGAGVIYDVWQSPALQTVHSLGLGLDQMAENVWEAIPLSWFADYLSNTGNWLQAIVPKAGVVVRGSWATSVVEQSCGVKLTLGLDFPPDLSPQTWRGSGGALRSTSRSMNRAVDVHPSWTFDSHELTAPQLASSLAVGYLAIAKKLKAFL